MASIQRRLWPVLKAAFISEIIAFFFLYWKKLLLFLSVFDPATIPAIADNDAGGVANCAYWPVSFQR